MKIFQLIIILFIIVACSSHSDGNDSTILGGLGSEETCNIIGLSESVETVYNYQLDHSYTDGGDYADNPVRPYLVKSGESFVVNWFASNSKGYCSSYSLPVSESVPDILATIMRTIDPQTGECARLVTSRFNESAYEYPASSYYNELWMVVPYTLDGINIMALIHNEYHITPSNVTNVYGNLIGANSSDAGASFNLYQINENNNQPVLVAPYPYSEPLNQGKGGMFAQTNIIKWGNYYYMLVSQVLNTLTPVAPESAPTGVCIYRTHDFMDFTSWRGWDLVTNSYDIPLVASYPDNLTNQSQYWCSSIPELPAYFHYSWTYNTALNQFILVGIDLNYNNSGNGAFVYTLASLDPDTGVLSPANNSNTYQIGFLRNVNSIDSWQTNESIDAQYYPSILDPASPNLSVTTTALSIESGDLNFQYSNKTPYLYYTYFYPHIPDNANGNRRDVVRQKILTNCD